MGNAHVPTSTTTLTSPLQPLFCGAMDIVAKCGLQAITPGWLRYLRR